MDLATDLMPVSSGPALELVGELRPRRLLVALDGRHGIDLALGVARRAAESDHAAITLLTVVAPVTIVDALACSVPGLVIEEPRYRAEQDALETLELGVRRLPADVPVKTLIRRGHAGRAICAEARSGHYDAIVLATRSKGTPGAMLGNGAAYVMRHAPVPVVVIGAGRSRRLLRAAC